MLLGLTLIVAMSGVANAAVTDPNGIVYGCVAKNGSLVILNPNEALPQTDEMYKGTG
jgi:hypothetical protein